MESKFNFRLTMVDKLRDKLKIHYLNFKNEGESRKIQRVKNESEDFTMTLMEECLPTSQPFDINTLTLDTVCELFLQLDTLIDECWSVEQVKDNDHVAARMRFIQAVLRCGVAVHRIEAHHFGLYFQLCERLRMNFHTLVRIPIAVMVIGELQNISALNVFYLKRVLEFLSKLNASCWTTVLHLCGHSVDYISLQNFTPTSVYDYERRVRRVFSMTIDAHSKLVVDLMKQFSIGERESAIATYLVATGGGCEQLLWENGFVWSDIIQVGAYLLSRCNPRFRTVLTVESGRSISRMPLLSNSTIEMKVPRFMPFHPRFLNSIGRGTSYRPTIQERIIGVDMITNALAITCFELFSRPFDGALQQREELFNIVRYCAANCIIGENDLKRIEAATFSFESLSDYPRRGFGTALYPITQLLEEIRKTNF